LEKTILIIQPSVSLDGGGNIAQFIISNSFRRNGQKVYTVSFCGSFPSEFPKDHFSYNFLAKKKSKIYKYLFSLDVYRFLKKVINQTSPDIIIIGQYWSLATISYIIWKFQIKAYHIVHTAELFCLNSMLTKKKDMSICSGTVGIKCIKNNCESINSYIIKYFLNMFSNFVIKHIFHGTICHSQFMKQKLSNNNFKNITYLPLSLDIRKSENLKIISNNILFVGSLTWHKGIKETIDAIKYVKKSIPNVLLNIIGSGPLREELEMICESKNLHNSVKFHGIIGREKIADFFEISQIVLIPSYFESFGLVALEAIKHQKKIIISNRGALPEVVQNYPNSIILDTISPKEIASVLIKQFNLPNNKSNFNDEKYSQKETDKEVKKFLSEVNGVSYEKKRI
jgi:glycosyltransferase involved in cell wall biosynthesis